MDQETTSTPSPDESLREILRTEMQIEGIDVVGEKALEDALSALPGVERAHLADGKATVCYDPLVIRRVDLVSAIAGKGFRITETETDRVSPLADLAPNGQPAVEQDE